MSLTQSLPSGVENLIDATIKLADLNLLEAGDEFDPLSSACDRIGSSNGS